MLFDNLPIFLLGFFVGLAIFGLTHSLIDEIENEVREIYRVMFVIFGYLAFMFLLIITAMV